MPGSIAHLLVSFSQAQNSFILRLTRDNLRVLNMSTMRWQRISSHGKAVINRYGHSCTLVGPHLFFFGGWDGTSALNQLAVGEFEIN
uniref:Uncharacterized protein AlNc14C602G12224 n=1 Tax=Albugo laibachii Nc14 TaxID=890382 RepID=F0X1D2_9STRA|nr:conserved hypothetical protein [Albugo laibachii Nc14]|eukprot:CCA27609.1 conserved hypothetical protein [Albugo laibachii Nc14]